MRLRSSAYSGCGPLVYTGCVVPHSLDQSHIPGKGALPNKTFNPDGIGFQKVGSGNSSGAILVDGDDLMGNIALGVTNDFFMYSP